MSRVKLNVHLFARQTVCEWLHEGAGREIKNQTERDRNRQGRQCLLEDGQ